MAALMNCADLSRALGARLISFNHSQDHSHDIDSVSIDSRTIQPKALFVALRGEVTDGHNYIKNAFEKGATAVMIDKIHWESEGKPIAEIAGKCYGIILVVEDTLRGLQKTAEYYLEQFPQLLKIGITGSSGKTSTKEITAAMVGEEKKVVMSQGNLNSETGLPLSVFAVRDFHEIGIFELGINRPGEMKEIAGVLKPHIALITNIGSAHIGFLGKQGIAEEKKMIFSRFSGTETALVPYDDFYRDFLAQGVKGNVVFYGAGQTQELGEVRNKGIDGFDIQWDGQSTHFGLAGEHNLKNALAAAAIAKQVNISSDAIRRGFAKAKGLFGRTEIIRDKITLIRDCYNANPESMKAAIDMCDSLDVSGKRVYVIGSMLELGNETQNAHEKLGTQLALSKADIICFYGEETQSALSALLHINNINNNAHNNAVFHTSNREELTSFLSDNVKDGDLVLLKGSRACALEKLSGILIAGAD